MKRSRNVSSTDSALGSDIEVERDGKLVSDDDRVLEAIRSFERNTRNLSNDDRRFNSIRPCNTAQMGVAAAQDQTRSYVYNGSLKASGPQTKQDQHLQDDEQRLERDKAVARLSRTLQRQQHVQKHRRADSQPAVIQKHSPGVTNPPCAVDDMLRSTRPEGYRTDRGRDVSRPKNTDQQPHQSTSVDCDRQKTKFDTDHNTSLPLIAQLFGHVVDRVTQVRKAVCQVLQSRFEHFASFPQEVGLDSTKMLLAQITNLQPVFAYIEQSLESDPNCEALDRAKYHDKLNHYRRMTSAIYKYIDTRRMLASIDQHLQRPNKVHTALVDDLDRLDAILSTLDRNHSLEKQSLFVLQIEVYVMRQRVLKEIDEAWNSIISWQLPPYDGDDDSATDGLSLNCLTTLNLSGVSQQQVEHCCDIANASSKLGRIDDEVSAFCERLLTRLIREITGTDWCGSSKSRDKNRNTAAEDRKVIVINNNNSSLSVVAVPDSGELDSPELIFEQLEQIFDFLDRVLSGIKISVVPNSPNGLSVSIPLSCSSEGSKPSTIQMNSSTTKENDDEESLMKRIGDVALAKILDCIYVDCLSKFVEKPDITTDEEFSNLDRLALIVEKFEHSLRNHFKISTSGSDLGYERDIQTVSLVGKIREACARAGAARCGRLLAEANSLIIGNNHLDGQLMPKTVYVSAQCVLGEGLAINQAQIDKFVSRCREETKTAGFRLPTCTISTSVRDLVCLIYNTLRQSLNISPQGAQVLRHAVYQVVELYCDLEPFYYRDRLTTSPAHAALHHNNCMYLAHHLITVDKVFARHKYSPQSNPVNSGVTTLSNGSHANDCELRDLVSKVKLLGNDCFTRHINSQKRQLGELLSKAKGFNCMADDVGFDAEQAVSAVLDQLKSIADDWRGILPLNAYCRSIGRLLNIVLREIIDSVLNVCEFSVDDCQCLQRVLSLIIDCEESIFPVCPRQSIVDDSPKPRRKLVDEDRVQAQQHMDEECPAEVILERCVPAWPKFLEVVNIFSLDLAGVAERWGDGNGPLAMRATGLEVAQLVEAIFERTVRRENLVQKLRHQSTSARASAAHK